MVSFVNTMLGHKNSPHEPIKVNIARTARDGFTIGNKTFQNTWKTLQPSTIAASSISRGIAKNACLIKNIPNALTANGIISPIKPIVSFTLSTRWSFNVIKYTGNIIAWNGTIIVAKIEKNAIFLPLNSILASG